MLNIYPTRTDAITPDIESEALRHIVTLSVRKGVASTGSAVPTWEEYLGDLMTACIEASEWLQVNGVPSGPVGSFLIGQLEEAFDETFSNLSWHTGFDLSSLNPDYSDRVELVNRELESGRWQ